ncbi:gag-pol polyprotein [Cucumis melo var. makuwa]|uniref:Gag-pol polyprotein n=1 Tax=Cucumis melo var. makuwa TaxID=1194695 RepID=A0A5D3B8F5_CUCMM|nr:gag-pol polyprotein [Cucumis melo var. makuwa]
MELIKEDWSTTLPSVLDGINYSCWIARMISFLKSIDHKTWKAIVAGWSPPQVTNTDRVVSPEPENEWTVAEDEGSIKNSRALDAIFNRVD